MSDETLDPTPTASELAHLRAQVRRWLADPATPRKQRDALAWTDAWLTDALAEQVVALVETSGIAFGCALEAIALDLGIAPTTDAPPDPGPRPPATTPTAPSGAQFFGGTPWRRG